MTSLPSISPNPPGSTKSRCMSMMMSAVDSGSNSRGYGSAGNSYLAILPLLGTTLGQVRQGRRRTATGEGGDGDGAQTGQYDTLTDSDPTVDTDHDDERVPRKVEEEGRFHIYHSVVDCRCQQLSEAALTPHPSPIGMGEGGPDAAARAATSGSPSPACGRAAPRGRPSGSPSRAGGRAASRGRPSGSPSPVCGRAAPRGRPSGSPSPVCGRAAPRGWPSGSPSPIPMGEGAGG